MIIKYKDGREIEKETCVNCGKLVIVDTGYYTREIPDYDCSCAVICCNEQCADEYKSGW
tara:strand:- start:84 stop:260 length:177 start_codon:yes stop_codon:yes gene_type:complete